MASSSTWQLDEVRSPNLIQRVLVISARNVPYVAHGHRFQNINIYIRKDFSTESLVGQPVTALPVSSDLATHVHVHGGAWRDPDLTSASIEPYVAHAFFAPGPLMTIASINYTLSPFPTHPYKPYDAIKTPGVDPSREAKHPAHVADVLRAFALLRTLGLAEYLLTGHSAGACLAFQTTLVPPEHYGLDLAPPPRPAALIGLNGLYDLIALVHGLGPTHAALSSVYRDFENITFGADQAVWPAASPALFLLEEIEQGMREGRVARVVYLDQSVDDQLVPVNQADRMQALLDKVQGLRVVRGHSLTGAHAAPWEQGYMIWDIVLKVLEIL